MTPEAKKYADEILQICKRKSRGTGEGLLVDQDDILVEFSKAEQSSVKHLLRDYLVKIKYLRRLDSDPSIYAITTRGEAYIDSLGGGSSIRVGDNSAVAINSPHATQTIHVNDLPEETQQLIADFNRAAESKDASALKKTFGYIADKSVDVAIAMATGALLR